MPSPRGARNPAGIAQRILVLRGQRVLLNSDLAVLNRAQTERLNPQVRRNPGNFPADFVFQLNINEVRRNRLQIAGCSGKHGNLRHLPLGCLPPILTAIRDRPGWRDVIDAIGVTPFFTIRAQIESSHRGNSGVCCRPRGSQADR